MLNDDLSLLYFFVLLYLMCVLFIILHHLCLCDMLFP